MLERGEIELDHREGLGRGQEGHFGAAILVRVAHGLERRDRVAVGEFHGMLFAVAPDAKRQLRRQRVDHRDADAVQAAGHLVGVLVEFSAGVQLGHDDFGRRHAFLLVDVGRNAAAIVAHRAGAVGIERHRHRARVAGERLVDRVVDDLVDHVVQARTVVGVADVHPGTLANRVEAFQDLDRFRVIGGGGTGVGHGLLAGRFGHAKNLRISAAKYARERCLV